MKFYRFSTGMLVAGLLMGAATTPSAWAAKKNPTSKLYVADLEGQSEIDTGERIEELSKKSVHNAQGTVIQTSADSNNAMVFSNGTGVYLDPETRMEVKRFMQEPFTPDRTDLQSEPSISQTSAFIPRGTVGLCTPRMVAGSTMVYSTPQTAVQIRGQKVVIQTDDYETKVSIIDGDVTIRGGATDGGGQTLRGGQQAVIRRVPGQPPQIDIHDIPEDEREFIEDKVTLACEARKTVYFDVRGKKPDETGFEGDDEIVSDSSNPSDDEGDNEGEGWASVFDDLDETAGADAEEIIAVEVTPVEPIQESVVSPSSANG